MVLDGDRSEVCRTDPGHDEDLVVASESQALTEWHLGRLQWADAVRLGRIKLAGSRYLVRGAPLEPPQPLRRDLLGPP